MTEANHRPGCEKVRIAGRGHSTTSHAARVPTESAGTAHVVHVRRLPPELGVSVSQTVGRDSMLRRDFVGLRAARSDVGQVGRPRRRSDRRSRRRAHNGAVGGMFALTKLSEFVASSRRRPVDGLISGSAGGPVSIQADRMTHKDQIVGWIEQRELAYAIGLVRDRSDP
jgi:hypothetical protein